MGTAVPLLPTPSLPRPRRRDPPDMEGVKDGPDHIPEGIPLYLTR